MNFSERHGKISTIDVKQDPKTAKRYKIRATPSVILVKDGVIEDILLGAKSPSKLETLLNKII